MDEKECELVRALRFLGRETISGRVSITWRAADRITRLEADRAAAIEGLERLIYGRTSVTECYLIARETLTRIKEK